MYNWRVSARHFVSHLPGAYGEILSLVAEFSPIIRKCEQHVPMKNPIKISQFPMNYQINPIEFPFHLHIIPV